MSFGYDQHKLPSRREYHNRFLRRTITHAPIKVPEGAWTAQSDEAEPFGELEHPTFIAHDAGAYGNAPKRQRSRASGSAATPAYLMTYDNRRIPNRDVDRLGSALSGPVFQYGLELVRHGYSIDEAVELFAPLSAQYQEMFDPAMSAESAHYLKTGTVLGSSSRLTLDDLHLKALQIINDYTVPREAPRAKAATNRA